jgi:hypothetical protein
MDKWSVKHYTSEEWPVIKSDGIELECAGATREQAEEISAALNAHDELVRALRKIAEFDKYEPAGPAAETAKAALAKVDAS